MQYSPSSALNSGFISISLSRSELHVNLFGRAPITRPKLVFIEGHEEWWLRRYDGSANAVRVRAVHSAEQHLVDKGAFEAGLPFTIQLYEEMQVDEKWCLHQTRAVTEAVRHLSTPPCFDQEGCREGRHPAPQA